MAMEGSDDGSSSSSPEHSRSRQSVEELQQVLVCTAFELESLRAKMRSQRQMFEARVSHLEELVRQAQKERQEAVRRYEELVNFSTSSSIPVEEDEDWLLFPSSDQQKLEDESVFLTPLQQQQQDSRLFAQEVWMNQQQFIQSSAVEAGETSAGAAGGGFLLQNGSALASILTPLQQQQQQDQTASLKLPERGRLLEAVMQAGPLLNTLLLAGPLPQWHHPPPGMLVEDRPIVAPSYNASSPAASEQQQSSCVSDGEPPSFVYKQHATKVC